LDGSPFQPNEPAPTTIFAKHGGAQDSHGMLLNEVMGGRYLWVADRFSNAIEVVDTDTDQLVDSFSLVGRASSDPAPDLIEITPGGEFGVVTLRGACPLTANSAAVNNAVGATPGVGLIKVRKGGSTGDLTALAPIHNPAPSGFDCPTRTDDTPGSITNQADPHGLAVRPTHE
jgi:DNA-binding beta-propeller fold protein YncE